MDARKALEYFSMECEEHGVPWAWEDWANAIAEALNQRDELLEILCLATEKLEVADQLIDPYDDGTPFCHLDEGSDVNICTLARAAISRAESHLSTEDPFSYEAQTGGPGDVVPY